MKAKINFILFICTFISFQLSSQNSTISNGNWNNGTHWASGVPGSTDSINVNHRMILDRDLPIASGGIYKVNSTITDTVGGFEHFIDLTQFGKLDVNSNVTIGSNLLMNQNATLIIRSYDTLLVRGNAEFKQQSKMTIEANGVLIIDGNFNLNQQSTNTVHGKIYVRGNITANQNAIIDGNGNVEADGDVNLNNGTTFFGNGGGCTSGCEYGSGAGLPIELKSFEATLHPFNNNLVEVKWTTLSEINNQFFVVEHSIDGENFEAVDQIEGAGNSNKELNYSRIITIVENSLHHYFRLKQIDFDGSSKTFNAVAVKQSNNSAYSEKQSLAVYPNPTNGNQLNIDLQNFETGIYDLILMNSNGQTIINKSINFQNSTDQNIDLLNGIQLSKGIYFVRLMAEEPITQKIIVN